ncbi:MAG: hypothetical protein AAB401_21065, partial [Acidobacteriota bacterium]
SIDFKKKKCSPTKTHEGNTKKTKTGLTRFGSGLTGLTADPVNPEKNPVHPIERLQVCAASWAKHFLKIYS